jgi:4-hydroxy-3-polyprenylbenzoate decarboxylase
VVGVSGASGSPYARAVVVGLLDAGLPVDLVVSRAARLTILDETGVTFRDAHWKDDLTGWLGRDIAADDVVHWPPGDLAAAPSSGSYPTRGMVVVPASTAAVAGIAMGLSKDLLQRAADVTLKERRPLVVVPRETPYTRATLQHMLALSEAGATVLPASPSTSWPERSSTCSASSTICSGAGRANSARPGTAGKPPAEPHRARAQGRRPSGPLPPARGRPQGGIRKCRPTPVHYGPGPRSRPDVH